MKKMSRDEVKVLLTLLSDLSSKLKYVLSGYLLYLILPPLVMIRLSNLIELFQEYLNNNSSNAMSLIKDIVFYYELYASIYSVLLITLAITIILMSYSKIKLSRFLEIKESKFLTYPYLFWGNYAITLAMLNIILLSLNINTIREQLYQSINSGTLLLELNIEPLRTLVIIHETVFSIATIALSFSLSEISNRYEIFHGLDTGGTILAVGGLITLIETILIGIGIGPIVIATGYYVTRRNLLKIKNEIKKKK